jgi:hypothetical protein
MLPRRHMRCSCTRQPFCPGAYSERPSFWRNVRHSGFLNSIFLRHAIFWGSFVGTEAVFDEAAPLPLGATDAFRAAIFLLTGHHRPFSCWPGSGIILPFLCSLFSGLRARLGAIDRVIFETAVSPSVTSLNPNPAAAEITRMPGIPQERPDL